jgi:hypothetical protein
MPVVSALWRLRPEDGEFKASTGCSSVVEPLPRIYTHTYIYSVPPYAR